MGVIMCETDPRNSELHEVNIPIDLDVVNITSIKIMNIKLADTHVFLPIYLVIYLFFHFLHFLTVC